MEVNQRNVAEERFLINSDNSVNLKRNISLLQRTLFIYATLSFNMHSFFCINQPLLNIKTTINRIQFRNCHKEYPNTRISIWVRRI